MNTEFHIAVDVTTLEFNYGEDVYGPKTEKRKLDDIRKSLSNPNVDGPEYVYAVAMDVAKNIHKDDLQKRNLLYGAMIFCKGVIGNEPVRSQGHVHAISKSCNASTCEVYEIWSGEAYIYMQEFAKENPGRCYAIHANVGDVVVVPPNWVHATINANPAQEMLFGAWCVRDYGFDYDDIRTLGGIAFFPIAKKDGIVFERNVQYRTNDIIIKKARTYPEFMIEPNVPIYEQYEKNPDLFKFVANPEVTKTIWDTFIP